MPGDGKLKKIGEAYEEACSYVPHSDSGDSVQESDRLINSAYENTLNLGHPTPPTENLNRRELRSGRSYHTIPQERDPTPPYQASLPTPTSMTQQPSHIIAAPVQVASAPIWVIPTHISIRQFSGSDVAHTARQYLDFCEAAIVNSSITEDHDKIAFIRSRLSPGSRALIMMQSSAFTHTDSGTNYDAFKKKNL